MTAQINLYHASFRQKHLLLTFTRMLIIIGLSAMSIPAIIGLNYVQVNKITAHTSMLRDSYVRLESEWQKSRTKLSSNGSTPDIATQAIKFETILAHRTELMQFIRENSFDKSMGYSDFLTALARQHTYNIWLTNVSILKNGTMLSIEGKINDSSVLPRYLQRLASEPVMAGRQFETLKISRDDDDKHGKTPLNFIVASTSGLQ